MSQADPFILIPGTATPSHPTGRYRMSEVIYDMRAFSHIKDSILDIIETASDPALAPAQDILRRIAVRDLYVCVGRTAVSRTQAVARKTEQEVLAEVVECSRVLEAAAYNLSIGRNDDDDDAAISFVPICSTGSTDPVPVLTLQESDLIVEKMHIHYGMGSKNPVANLRFFRKQYPANTVPVAHQINENVYETFLPRVFEDRGIRLFCRFKEKEELAKAAFDSWCRQSDSHSPFPSCSQSQHSWA